MAGSVIRNVIRCVCEVCIHLLPVKVANKARKKKPANEERE